MNKTAFRITTIILASFAVASFFGTAAWHSSSAQGAAEKGIEERSVRVGGMDRSKLQSLQLDLIETLRVLRSALEQQRQTGFVTTDDLVRENIESPAGGTRDSRDERRPFRRPQKNRRPIQGTRKKRRTSGSNNAKQPEYSPPGESGFAQG